MRYSIRAEPQMLQNFMKAMMRAKAIPCTGAIPPPRRSSATADCLFPEYDPPLRDVLPTTMKRSLLPDPVESYVDAAVAETDAQRNLRAETARLPNAGMQIGPDQGALLALLVRAL